MWLSIPAVEGGVFRAFKDKSRSIGGSLSGVSLYIEGKVAYFVVKYYENDRWAKKRYSIKKLGYRKAFVEAAKFRILNTPSEISLVDVPIHRPTLEQYLVLMHMVDDVPIPIV